MAEVSFLLRNWAFRLLTPDLMQFVSARVYEMRAQMNAGKLEEEVEKPKHMLVRLLQHRYNGSDELMPDLDIISEAMGHMFVFLFSTCYT